MRGRLAGIAESSGSPGLVVAAYDTELFGHWWHEGPAFLGKAVRALREAGVEVTTVARAIADGHVAGDLDLGPGSWGAGKDFSVWDGPGVRDIAHENEWLQRRWLDVVAPRARAGTAGAPASRPGPAAADPVQRALQRLGLPGHARAVRRLREEAGRGAPAATSTCWPSLVEDGRRHEALVEASAAGPDRPDLPGAGRPPAAPSALAGSPLGRSAAGSPWR